ncbi:MULTISPECIES: SDR family oxidoreductase [Agrobacterium]|uniref:SDR family oxidoreductase n=1 Tax=Agrobacterium TaxID=357 RepID=UPI003BA0D825
MNNVAGKVIIITGASSGLGQAAARLLSAKGASVVLGARRAKRIEELAEELKSNGALAVAVPTDVSKRRDVQALVDEALRTFGTVDVMLNNAGVMPLSLLERLEVDKWEVMVDINLKGVMYGIAAALPHMIERKSGHFINVASTAGHRVGPTTAIYSATKHAVRALSEGLRQEMTPHNIRSTIISPGASSTELMDLVKDDSLADHMQSAAKYALPPETFAEMVLFAISQPESVDVNEILFRPTAQQA